jgi:aspartate kinase
MIVMKFGGTSVGTSNSIKKVVDIVTSSEQNKIVVLSAFSGVTNLLVSINNAYENQEQSALKIHVEKLETKCLNIVNSLFDTSTYAQVSQNFIYTKIQQIKEIINTLFSEQKTKIIIGLGEIISTNIIQFYLQEKGIHSSLISALDFMKTDKNNEPNIDFTSRRLENILKEKSANIYITQGFICKDIAGEISNLDRGGSDYTASLIGAAINADEIQIWTDIDGMHNNDPRFVENTFSIEEISFDEAAELAYFGAKILHPQSLIPAKNSNIPVLLKNTFNPSQKGTVIKNSAINEGVTSIAAKDGITAIKIKSYRMLLAYGFLKKVFEVFETYQTPIDMITTSEVAVSLTIDNASHLSSITTDLKTYGLVEIDSDLSIICVAGDFSQNKEGISAQVFNALKHIPIRMISYGGSNYNISLLVKTADKKAALNALNQHLFEIEKNVLV